jgi:hypothetical protein
MVLEVANKRPERTVGVAGVSAESNGQANGTSTGLKNYKSGRSSSSGGSSSSSSSKAGLAEGKGKAEGKGVIPRYGSNQLLRYLGSLIVGMVIMGALQHMTAQDCTHEQQRREEQQRSLLPSNHGDYVQTVATPSSCICPEIVKEIADPAICFRQIEKTKQQVEELQQKLSKATQGVGGMHQRVEQQQQVQEVEQGGDKDSCARATDKEETALEELGVCTKELDMCTSKLQSAALNTPIKLVDPAAAHSRGHDSRYDSSLSQWMKLGSAITLYIDETKLSVTSVNGGIPAYDYRCGHTSLFQLLIPPLQFSMAARRPQDRGCHVAYAAQNAHD